MHFLREKNLAWVEVNAVADRSKVTIAFELDEKRRLEDQLQRTQQSGGKFVEISSSRPRWLRRKMQSRKAGCSNVPDCWIRIT